MSPVPVLPPALPGGDTSDILILGALVLDGSGGEPYVADVLLQAGRITAIAARAPASGARLDAPGARRIHARIARPLHVVQDLLVHGALFDGGLGRAVD